MDLDHVFLLCDPDAPEAEALRRIGLHEGPPNTHPGQGTACRRFFFGDTYLELLWITDEREARSAAVSRTALWERWQARRSGACPFGVVLRPSIDEPPDAAPPFPTWRYAAPYLAGGAAIEIGDGAALNEPFVAWLGSRREPLPRAEPVAGGIAIGHLTEACLSGPLPSVLSAPSEALVTEQVLDLEIAPRFRLTLTFDRGESGRTADLGPELPLALHW